MDDGAQRPSALRALSARRFPLRFAAPALRTRAATRLRDAEQLVTLAFDNAPAGMLIYSLDTARLGEILNVNGGRCVLLHRSRDELLGRHVRTLGPAGDAPTVDALLDDLVAARRTTCTRERVLLRADGREIPTTQAINVVRPQHGAPYAITQITDLNDRVEAEQALAQALDVQLQAVTQLRELNEARVEAAARLAHDLRSPLSCVRVYQELLISGAAGDLTAEQNQMLEVALRNADRVIELVDDLVSTASLELDEIDLVRLEHIPLGSVLTAALDTVQPVCTSKGQNLARPSTGLEVVVARRSGAARAGPGQPGVERGEVHARGRPHRRRGPRDLRRGRDRDQRYRHRHPAGAGRDRLGEQFFRADTARAAGVEGTGLGLAVAKAFIAKHHGTLRISSSPGEGSTFVVCLPAAMDRAADSRDGVPYRARLRLSA